MRLFDPENVVSFYKQTTFFDVSIYFEEKKIFIGGVAQLVECSNSMRRVSGSIPKDGKKIFLNIFE